MTRIVVVGGGISGLACARHLADRLPHADLVVLEAGDRPGGTIRSVHEHGFTWETGPNGFLNRHPSTLALALRLGLGDELVTGCEQFRKRFVLHRGRLRRFPDSLATFLSSDLLSVGARLRMLVEPLVRPAPEGSEETVGQFARRRLGRQAADLLVEPVVSGIYAGDPDRLGLSAALPQLAALDGRGKSVLKAYLKSRADQQDDAVSPTAVGRRRLVSFRGGAARLVEALAESLGDSVRCDSPVQRVTAKGGALRVVVSGPRSCEVEADAVVSAMPAPATAAALGGLSPDLALACRGITHAPVAMVALGFREADVPHPLDAFGYLVAGSENSSVLGVLWASSIFPGHRSPPGTVLLQAILGGARDRSAWTSSDDELIDAACAQLEPALGITSAPVFARTHRHATGIPQYEVGHARRLQAVDAAQRSVPGLFVTGNAFRGVGLNQCTTEAERIADEVVRYLGARDAGRSTRPRDALAPRTV